MQPRIAITKAVSSASNMLESRGVPIEHLISAFQSFRIGTAVVDRRLRYTSVNYALAKMHNLPLKTHIGRSVREVLGPLSARVVPLLEHVFSTGQPLANVQLSGRLSSRQDIGEWIVYMFPLMNRLKRVVEVGVFALELRSNSTLQCSPDAGTISEYSGDPGMIGQQLHLGGFHNSGVGNVGQSGTILSCREHEVLQLLAMGNSNKEISSLLEISVKTVETYRSRVKLKLQLTSVADLIFYAINHEIISM